jgi:hypothetical protein
MRDLRGARNGKHNRATLENPGESNLARSGVVGPGNGIKDRAPLGEVAGSERKPGNEADATSLTIVQHVFTAAPSSGNSLKGSDRLCSACGRTPDAGTGEAHRPEAEAIDLDLSTDPK